MTWPIPSSPEDDDARRDAARHYLRIGLVWGVPMVLLGGLAIGLGVPWWLVLAILAVIVVWMIFES